jgi:hypothetical protein
MDINEAIMWAEHAQTSMQVNGDPYGAKMLGEAVKALRTRLAEVEGTLSVLRKAIEEKGGTEHAPTLWAYDQACAALHKKTARLAEVEAQRDMLKRVIIFIRDECDWEPTMHESGGDERIGNVITDALAKLEEK